jgi:Flp pilus assembly protein TadG
MKHIQQQHRRASWRRGQRGQIAPLVAIFAVVLLGATALSIDLSVSTHYKRSVQNVTDAAALAGAKQLPASPSGTDEANAVRSALDVVRNSYPWQASAGWETAALSAAGCGSSSPCSVTICSAGYPGASGCTETVGLGSTQPFTLTVNSPPKTSANGVYNGVPGYVEVVMHQATGGFFTAFVGGSDRDGAQSVAYHFAPNQPFPFALFSQTIVQSGNQGENIHGNVYADRNIQPQSSGLAGICAGDYTDASGTTQHGFVYLGYPQIDDGSAYPNKPSDPNEGQANNSKVGPNAQPLQTGVSCPVAGGFVGMTGSPGTTGCSLDIPGTTNAALRYDGADNACEANPPIQPPTVDSTYIPPYNNNQQFGCTGNSGLKSGSYQPGEYSCSNGAALTVDTSVTSLAPGIYEIDAQGGGGCDVLITAPKNTVTSLDNVTFYLKNGAQLCVNPSGGALITGSPYRVGNNAGNPYVVLSDGSPAPTPTITMNGKGGSGAGIWRVTGTIWLPTGTVNIYNKNALEDTGQIIIGSWNDTSGNHPNPTVTYSPANAPGQKEQLRLVQ